MFNGSRPPADIPPDLLRDACAGDPEATEQLVRALLPRVRNLVRYLIRGDRDLDDVAQEALVSVLRGLDNYRGDGAFRSWVDRVVARATFAWLKRRKLAEDRYDSTVLETSGSEDTARPTDEYLKRRRVLQALELLPAEQRYAMVLHHVLEMSVPELAKETGVPLETARSRLRLGRRRMRDELYLSTEQKVS